LTTSETLERLPVDAPRERVLELAVGSPDGADVVLEPWPAAAAPDVELGHLTSVDGVSIRVEDPAKDRPLRVFVEETVDFGLAGSLVTALGLLAGRQGGAAGLRVAVPLAPAPFAGPSLEAWARAAFHAALTWLGIDGGPFRAIVLTIGRDSPPETLRAGFRRQAAAHRDLPHLHFAPPLDLYPAVAEPAWRWARQAPLPETVTPRQAFAVRLYTGAFYQQFHDALRPRDPDDPRYVALLPVIAALDAGLANLPPVPGTTFRGERGEDDPRGRRRLAVGDVFAEPSYTSTSESAVVAARMRSGFLFRIAGRSGREISAFSDYPAEREILFGRDLHQRVARKNCGAPELAIDCEFDTGEL
jgi:NAD:arginine ADP-ribosyltransferase